MPSSFVCIHAAIRTRANHLEGVSWLNPSHPETKLHAPFQLAPDAQKHRFCVIFLGVGQDNEELIAPDAPQRIRGTQQILDSAAK